MMGGKIWLESELNQGSKFHFTIQVRAARVKIDHSLRDSMSSLKNLRVLIVDDNAINRHILEETLKRWEMEPTCVESGERALAELAVAKTSLNPYGLILTDMHMPSMDGFTFVEKVRQIDGLNTTTIMMLTSAANTRDIQRCHALDIKAYLFKPIRRTELAAAIMNVLCSERGNGGEPTETALKAVHGDAIKLNILLAEDNRVNQVLATRVLEKMGHKVTVVDTGVGALSALDSSSYDLVLMDIQMPQMDGLTATQNIRAREVKTSSHIPIIAMTAHAMTGDREKCLRAGMDGYVSKPISVKDVESTIAEVMGWSVAH